MTSLARTAPPALIAVASLGLAFPAVATAQPEWDIGSYDSCVAKVEDNWARGNIASDNLVDGYRECCEKSGGVWSGQGKDAHCVAPPAEASSTRWVGEVPVGVFTQDLTSAP